MSEKERYVFNFYTGAAYFNTYLSADNCTARFNINWSNLPTKYSKFRATICFRSNVFAGAGYLSDVGFINMSFARSLVYDGSMMYNNVGMVYPVVANTAVGFLQSYYVATLNDNSDFIIDYPQAGVFTVTLKTFAGAALANMPAGWNLQICLVGIEHLGYNNLLVNKLPTTN